MRRPCSKNDKVSGSGSREEPNFYEMSKTDPLPEDQQNAYDSTSLYPEGICAQRVKVRALQEAILLNETRFHNLRNIQARLHQDDCLFDSITMDMALPYAGHLQSNHASRESHGTQFNSIQEFLRLLTYRPSSPNSLNSTSASEPSLYNVLHLKQQNEYLRSKLLAYSNRGF